MRVRYSRRALSQLASVYEYLSARSPAGAKRVSASIKTTVARLEELPRLGKTTDEDDVYLIIVLYRVFYRLDRDRVFCRPHFASYARALALYASSQHKTDREAALRAQGNRALVKTFAFAAKAIAACAGSHVLTLDVVARIAVGVVVIDIALVRKPCKFLCHAV